MAAQAPIVRGATAIIYDGGQLDELEIAAIGRLQDMYGSLPVIALADFPLIDRVAAAGSIGASAVLGKPFDVEDFLAVLRGECRMSNKESRM
jgi:hypothetical protein